MGWFDTFLALILGTLLYVGGYQIYFYAQDRTQGRSKPFPAWARTLDECLPFVPQTVWAYTLLYYPTVVVTAVTVSRDWRGFAYTATSYLALLAVLTGMFFILPVTTPPSWRKFNPNASVHHKHLAWVQKMDGSNGCFPSGHAAISTLTGGLLAAQMGLGVGVTFAVLVCVSCVLCKQHYLVDIAGGILLGLGCLWLRGWMLVV